jgi:general secretion pathway protein C
MQALSLERIGLSQAVAASLATFAAIALLGVVLAYWTWVWFAPRAEARAQAAVQAAGPATGPTQAAYGLFGTAQAGAAGATAGAIGLLGVVAAPANGSGYAVLRLDAKQTVAVREGGEIEPGVRLAEVHADHIVMERAGVRETLALPKQSRPAVNSAPRTGK